MVQLLYPIEPIFCLASGKRLSTIGGIKDRERGKRSEEGERAGLRSSRKQLRKTLEKKPGKRLEMKNEGEDDEDTMK